jgi:hypothetical protein
MHNVDEIEAAILKLSPEEFAKLRDWLVEQDAQRWDEQIEADAKSGRLDELGEKALADLREGRCSDR